MTTLQSLQKTSASLLVALALAACGGGGGGGYSSTPLPTPTPVPVTPSPVPTVPPATEPGAPVLTNNVATDGLNWLNFRRSQAGLSVLTRNELIDTAAAGHSNYQKVNNTVTHVQDPNKLAYTGAHLLDRLTAVGYATPSYFYGEVISASTSSSGTYLAEELITAIYHRFAIFEPRFKEIGAGSTTDASGYTIFTNDFAANNGYGPGIGKGHIAAWPGDGKTGVLPNFFSNYEEPDPVAGINEVGYPISVHADADVVLKVTAFTVKPRGGADLSVKLLSNATDPVNMGSNTSAAAIVPLSPLAANTIYDVTFSGTTDGTAISKSWSFTTK